jgi:hypothetical protein
VTVIVMCCRTGRDGKSGPSLGCLRTLTTRLFRGWSIDLVGSDPVRDHLGSDLAIEVTDMNNVRDAVGLETGVAVG